MWQWIWIWTVHSECLQSKSSVSIPQSGFKFKDLTGIVYIWSSEVSFQAGRVSDDKQTNLESKEKTHTDLFMSRKQQQTTVINKPHTSTPSTPTDTDSYWQSWVCVKLWKLKVCLFWMWLWKNGGRLHHQPWRFPKVPLKTPE